MVKLLQGLQFFLPGTVGLIVLFTAIFATISITVSEISALETNDSSSKMHLTLRNLIILTIVLENASVKMANHHTLDDFADFILAFAEHWGSVTSVNLVDHKDDAMALNGNSYVPNLTDLKRVDFEGDQSSGAFSIGKTSGGYYAIAGIKRAE